MRTVSEFNPSNTPLLLELSSGAVATKIQRNSMENLHEGPNQSSPRLNSKYSKLPLDHHTNGAENMELHTQLNTSENHLSDSQESSSEDEDKHGIKDANDYVNNSNDNADFIDNDDDDNHDDFANNFGVFAKSCTVQAPPCPNADETSVGSEETAESLTKELNVSLRFNSQYSIDEDTGNSSVENKDGSLASSNSISSNNDTSYEISNTRSDKKKAKDVEKTSGYEKGNNVEFSVERNGEAKSQGARPKNLSQNPTMFNAFETNYHDGKIPSLETTGICQTFLARHSTDPSLPRSLFTESYDMRNSYSNDWTQHSITSNGSSSPLWSVPRSPAPERSGLMLEGAQSRGLGPRYGGPMPVNYQPVTPMTGQFPDANGFSQTSFSSFGDLNAGNGTQTASPSLSVSPLAPAVRYPAVTRPNSRINVPTTTSQYSSSTMSGSFPLVTSTNNAFNNYGQVRVVDFNRYRARASHGDTQENGGLNSSELGGSERQEERLRNHDLYSRHQEGSFASVSLRDPLLVSLEQQVAEIDRVLKEREERTKRQREAAQRQKEIRETRQREARERKEREEREMREQEERERKEREQTEIREREDRETRERELREIREREERETRERELREIREREERETRERELRELRDREERETREREDREIRERENTEGMGRELGGQREGEAMEREERIVDGNQSIQETPLWQCEHYQRRCSVKFPCCGVFYPCHRCHNLSETCSADDKKAHHATHVKCGNCGREEEDAFSGCQILPCSHKVHRECAIAMIQNGVRNCPICRHPLYGHLQQ
ncbi:Reticulocyte-binding protein 2-like a [Stylophora pistillata]|uniref:Reticulocyte-binding protein 2-like a n=1 Tax=Stylophora pistillata TaxID=50429 RepID=A0A2B4S7Y7_STYPI|nr:Reticulocyte-binding protein 2-like a [Stylophora pistillata]